MDHIYIESRLWACLTSEFLESVKSRYHYEEKDMEQLVRVASDMISCLKRQERTYIVFFEGAGMPGRADEQTTGAHSSVAMATVIMTLGAGIDMLQERYHRSGRLLESYMVESIAAELLMRGYEQLGEWVESRTGYYVRSCHFFGSEEGYPLASLPEVLARAKQSSVVCNEAFSLTPKKSVVLVVDLSEHEVRESVRICAVCSRRDSCTVRMQIPEERSMQNDSCNVVHL